MGHAWRQRCVKEPTQRRQRGFLKPRQFLCAARHRCSGCSLAGAPLLRGLLPIPPPVARRLLPVMPAHTHCPSCRRLCAWQEQLEAESSGAPAGASNAVEVPPRLELLMPRSMLGSRGILRELDCCSNCPILDGCVVRGGGSPVGPVARRGVRSAARRARGTAERRRTAGVRHGWRGGQLELRERDIRRTHARDRRSSSLRGSTRHRSAQRPHSPATDAIVMQ